MNQSLYKSARLQRNNGSMLWVKVSDINPNATGFYRGVWDIIVRDLYKGWHIVYVSQFALTAEV
jgi:hypothetical protein